jgi:hypothetical protein
MRILRVVARWVVEWQFAWMLHVDEKRAQVICKLSVPLSELTPSIVLPASDAPAVLAADTRPKIT